MADEAGRDPEVVGYEWCAWYALQGDEPLERVAEAARDLQRKLGELGKRLGEQGDREGNRTTAAANHFMIAMAELLDPNGKSEFRAEIKRRKRGKPIGKMERARQGQQSASIVLKLVEQGWKQEAALLQATAQTGLSRAEIMTWLQYRRWFLTHDVGSGEMPPPRKAPAK